MRDAFGVERSEVSKLAMPKMPGVVGRMSTGAINTGEKMISRGSSAFVPKTGMGAAQGKLRVGAGKSLRAMGMNPGKTTLGVGAVGGTGVVGGGYAATRDRKKY